ncbi:MAG: hypothetical protein HY350_02770 [Candidatus Omnitrophica bacterium]|nr:hypothetical protein [Candidatus Omnitrophota bacterium]
MTLKKSKKGQAVLEYFILTIVVVTIVLFFSRTQHFNRIKDSLTNDNNNGKGNGAFDIAVNEILKGASD